MNTTWTPQRLKALRKAYKESQDKFCRRIGVTPGALQFWEQGKGPPSLPIQLLLDRLEEDIAAEAR